MAKKRSKPVQKPTLAETTRQLLINRNRTITSKKIAKTLDCSVSWLYSFQQGEIVDPGADRIQALYDLLSPNSPLQY